MQQKCVWGLFRVILTVTVLPLISLPAIAVPIDSFFDVMIERVEVGPTPPSGQVVIEHDGYYYVVEGGGSGYTTPGGIGPWFPYPDPNQPVNPPPGEPVPWWVNQWYYDHPFSEDRMKEIKVIFDLRLIDKLQPYDLTVAINWTNRKWNDTGPGGPPPLQEGTIERYLLPVVIDPILSDPTHNDIQHVELYYNIWDYNPEWVSIDVWGYNVQLTEGHLFHECLPVPEPASLVVMGLGLGGIVLSRLKKKR